MSNTAHTMRVYDHGGARPSVMKFLMLVMLWVSACCASSLAEAEFSELAALINPDTGVITVANDDQLSLALTYAVETGNSSQVIVNPLTGIVTSNIYSNETLAKRCHGCTVPNRPPIYYTRYQMPQQGVWWSPWYPVSNCEYDYLGSGESFSMSYSWTYTYSVTVGLTANWGTISSSFTIGVAESWGQTSTTTCTIPAGSVGQMWYQQKVAWGDMQQQNCKEQSAEGTTCGSWSQNYRVNAPVPNSYNLGCSTGSSNVRC